METQYDSKITRCPKLGDEITFSYCLREAGDLPCVRIIRCWQAAFDVTALLKERLSDRQWESFISTSPENKISSLIDLIERAQERK
jgi:hypothetical protein